MADRIEAEAFRRKAYGVRQRENLEEIADLFQPGVCFGVLGGKEPGPGECQSTMGGILDTSRLLDHSIQKIMIGGDRAAVYRREIPREDTDRDGGTDRVDVMDLKDGRIVWMKSFFDTVLATRLVGG